MWNAGGGRGTYSLESGGDLSERAAEYEVADGETVRRAAETLLHHAHFVPGVPLDLQAPALATQQTDKRTDLQVQILFTRYTNGNEKLQSTEIAVSQMQQKLELLKPILIEKNQLNGVMLINLQKKQKEVQYLHLGQRTERPLPKRWENMQRLAQRGRWS